MFDKEAIQELLKAQSITAANVSAPPNTVALPNDYQVHDLEKFAGSRRRMRGSMDTNSISDFAEYATAQKTDGHSAVFVDQKSMRAVAVLDLGGPEQPGHAEHTATFAPMQTAAYSALLLHINKPLSQQAAAEFIEDWGDLIHCYTDKELPNQKAVAALRKLTIEAMRKMESSEQSLSASKSTFESIQATSAETIPTHVYFRCLPHAGMDEREFVMRLGIVTAGDKPQIVLRPLKHEAHMQEMAEEVAGKVREAINASMPVYLGTFTKK